MYYYQTNKQYPRSSFVLLRALLLSLVLVSSLFGLSPTILIDPGHGGKFEGCQGGYKKLWEKDLTLAMSKKLAELLRKENITVTLTRTTDIHLADEREDDLKVRVAIIKKTAPDIFVSLHFNTAPTSSTRGFEIYVPYHQNETNASYMLAADIHQALAHNAEQNWTGNFGNINTYDRGIRAANVTIFKDITCPAVIIELDYLSNKAAEALFASPAHQTQIATALKDAIVKNLSRKKTKK